MSDKPRILIVEDDPTLSDMLDNYFRMSDYEVVTAAWGRDALRISTETPLHLVMLDIRLPDIDGYEVCRQLRLQRRTADVPILFLTEKRERGDRLHGLELGGIDYITKPFDVQELHLRVRNAISRAAQVGVLNPITELPEAAALDERLNPLLYSDDPWALLLLSIGGVDSLRQLYSFVAADEMLRAVALMIRNGVHEFGGNDDVIAHLTPESFLVLTTPDKIDALRSHLETRIRLSLANFYRFTDLDTEQGHGLHLDTGVIDYQSGQYDDAESARAALQATITPHP